MKQYILKFLPYFGCAFFFSLFINLLQLSYILYVRLLFDKVMISQSMPTLLYLTLGVIFAFLVMGGLEVLRSKLLVRVGVRMDRGLSEKVFDRMLHRSARLGAAVHTQGLKDVNTIRTFFGGAGIFAIFDTPWVPIYLAIVMLFHGWLGTVAVAGAVALLLLVLAQELVTARHAREHSEASITTQQFVNSTMRNSQVVHAMGMLPELARRWRGLNSREIAMEDELAGKEGFFQSSAKFIMMSVSLIIMVVGGYLVINHQITIGTMIAASMIMGKALSPILMLGTAWKQLVQSRIAYARLEDLFGDPSLADGEKQLPAPQLPAAIRVEQVSFSIYEQPVLREISFNLAPGEALAIIGPSGAGKSTLARVMLGLWPTEEGRVLWGEHDIRELDPEALGRATGYVAQDVELFSGTVAENIARMGNVDDGATVAAARAADAHEMILELPKGYDTPLGRGGVSLSGGQKQRVALARAFYGRPGLVVLDEPDSHLDKAGRDILLKVLQERKKEGMAVAMITHNSQLLGIADRVLEMREGRGTIRTPAEFT